MKRHSKKYIGTFQNNNEGIELYKKFIQSTRQIVIGGRFVKMVRGKNRPISYVLGWKTGSTPIGTKRETMTYKYYGNQRTNKATHFDLYLCNRYNYNKNEMSQPTIGNMVLS